jgi:HSP20 family protein
MAFEKSRSLRRQDPWQSFWQNPFGLRSLGDDERYRDRDRARTAEEASLAGWNPALEAFQRGDEFVVRADVPGVDKKDLTVEVEDNALVIQGQRSHVRENKDEGYYRSERSYGSFYRVVPLPEGAITDSIKATCRNGVLEVTMKAPPTEVTRGRQIEIGD